MEKSLKELSPTSVGSFVAHEILFLVNDKTKSVANVVMRLLFVLLLVWLAEKEVNQGFLSQLFTTFAVFYMTSVCFLLVEFSTRQKLIEWLASGTSLYRDIGSLSTLKERLRNYEVDKFYISDFRRPETTPFIVDIFCQSRQTTALTTRLHEMTQDQRKELRRVSIASYFTRTLLYPIITSTVLCLIMIPDLDRTLTYCLIAVMLVSGYYGSSFEQQYRDFVSRDSILSLHRDKIPYVRYITGVKPIH